MTVRMIFSAYCFLNNRRPLENIDPKLTIRKFCPPSLPANLDYSSSPSRILSNLFWYHLPWEKIVEEIGAMNILDTGCGSGSYGEYIGEYSGGRVARYVGIDVYENESWKTRQQSGKLRFYVFDGKSIAPHIPPQTNFFMSQSAVEHFRDDMGYFKEIKIFIEQGDRPVIQIHLFPSVACMKLYGRHGYRQYSPRTISHITRLFSDSHSILFALGGSACNQVHEQFITKPFIKKGIELRKEKPEAYMSAVRAAIKQENERPFENPSFWALVICSNWKRTIEFL